MSGLLSNAVSGLQASQNALRTAGHNISNANTAGYSRQEVNYVTRPEQNIGSAGFIGSGVTTASIERVVNEFATAQVRLDTSTYNQLSKYNTNIGKVDKLFADVSTGLAGALQTFFASMQNGANDPASTPGRQLIVTEAESLSVRFNNLHQRLTDIEGAVNGEIIFTEFQFFLSEFQLNRSRVGLTIFLEYIFACHVESFIRTDVSDRNGIGLVEFVK